MMRRRAWLAGLAAIAGAAQAAPQPEPGPMWEAHDAGSRAVIGHAPWGRFLARFRRDGADGIARVDDRAAVLEEAARRFLNHPRGATTESGRLVASSIYVWFGEDFGPTPDDVERHLRKHARQDPYTALSDIRQVGVDRYDWDLNELK